jgi:hypothetical protein
MANPRIMSAPEISTVNAVKFRVLRAEKDWHEALELVRQAAAAPGYWGPPLEDLEQIAAGIGEIRVQLRDWMIDEVVRDRIAPRRAKGSRRRLMELAARG